MNTLNRLLDQLSISEKSLPGHEIGSNHRKKQLLSFAHCFEQPQFDYWTRSSQREQQSGRVTQKIGNNLIIDYCYIVDLRDVQFETKEHISIGTHVRYSLKNGGRIVQNVTKVTKDAKNRMDEDGGWLRQQMSQHGGGGYVGCVSRFDGFQGKIDEAINFDRSNLLDWCYEPCVHDWVTCVPENDDELKKEVKFKVKPNRIIQISGPYHKRRTRYAFVGNVVHIDTELIDVSFIREGDVLFVIGVESSVFEQGWRAVGLCKIVTENVEENVIGRLVVKGCDGIIETRGYLYCNFERTQCSVKMNIVTDSPTYNQIHPEDVDFELSILFNFVAHSREEGKGHVKITKISLSNSSGPFIVRSVLLNNNPITQYPFTLRAAVDEELKILVDSKTKFDFNISELQIHLKTSESTYVWKKILVFQNDFTASSFVFQSFTCYIRGKDEWRRYTQSGHRARSHLRCRINKTDVAHRQLHFEESNTHEKPPNDLKDLMMSTTFSSRVLAQFYPYLQHNLNWIHYDRTLHTLLHLEQITVEMHAFQSPSHGVVFKEERQRLLSFIWPFSEDQLVSVMINDKIVADETFEGFIHKVVDDKVFVKFDVQFFNSVVGPRTSSMATTKRFKIRHIPDTSVFRRCHHAISYIKNEREFEHILFPRLSQCVQLNTSQCKHNEPINGQLNEMQRLAVEGILRWSNVHPELPSPPLLLFGPPGTGKTVTLVEAITQVYKMSTLTKILACAPSNAASDLICERILSTTHIPQSQIARIYAQSRNVDDIPSSLLQVKVHQQDIEPFLRRRVIVVTFSTASQLIYQSGRIPDFTHLFLDECAQATEPEALIPLRVAGGKGRIIVLAGDPCQLGSVIKCKEASEFGLNRSLMQRLMDQCPDVYSDERGYFFTLNNTYRFSYPCLIQTPSRMFYKDRLVAVRNNYVDSLNIDDNRVKKTFPRGLDFPLMFVQVPFGKCERCPVTMSCFNMAEAGVACKYVAIMSQIGVPVNEIGIITPYRKQIKVIRNLLVELFDQETVEMVRIGTAEQFQGDERTVIIVSTVRSSGTKEKDNIGFLHCPKRFNVSITRAKCFMILIGNGKTISMSPHWKAIIDYCDANQSIVGEGTMNKKNTM
ncbi:hypothetical protein ACOME3_006016 [Neoechinorhynchus agilis]